MTELRLRVDAWTGSPDLEGSPLDAAWKVWAGARIKLTPKPLAPEPLADLRDWRNERVGWGVVLAENPTIAPGERAAAADAPRAIRELITARGSAPIFRYRRESPLGVLRRYYPDGSAQDLSLVASERGIGRGCVPRYLLIYASPREIPWSFQYRLQAVAFVGRLDLGGQALDNYVKALLTDWEGAECRVNRTVVWAVDHGKYDITHLMRRALAAKLVEALTKDPDLAQGVCYVDGGKGGATATALLGALEESRPGLVVTTSHGMTGPLEDVSKMGDQLGIPVDENHVVLDMAEVASRWEPDGAIWYAHACCSAGAASASAFNGLVKGGSFVDKVLKGITAVGEMVAPLPRLLLGAPHPLRAFVGHVEPTFDWTIQQPSTQQILTSSIREALYTKLFQPAPVGFAFEECHRHGPQLDMLHAQARADYAQGQATEEEMLAYRLMAQDRESLVILGDPTATLPALRAGLEKRPTY